jgi:hypothetical protein
MKSRMCWMLIASLGVIGLADAANETFAASKGMSHGGFASSHHRLAGHFFRHHRGPEAAIAWPGDDGFFSGPMGAPLFDGAPPTAGAQRTNTNDIPWDWAHRNPPLVAPSDRPYVASCTAETVTVPDGRGGNGQVNIMRCY